jgi:hypothetical protein
MAQNYSWVTDDMMCSKLAELLDDMSGGAILQIPGVYEAVSEHLNNEALEALETEHQYIDTSPQQGVREWTADGRAYRAVRNGGSWAVYVSSASGDSYIYRCTLLGDDNTTMQDLTEACEDADDAEGD